jgi:translation initiation factor 6 (eIF-6)
MWMITESGRLLILSTVGIERSNDIEVYENENQSRVFVREKDENQRRRSIQQTIDRKCHKTCVYLI